MSVLPLQYAVYKGMGGKFGAAQFNLQPAHRHCLQCKKRYFTDDNVEYGKNTEGKGVILCPADHSELQVREGTVFLEVTSAKEKNIYDWTKKITIALSTTDLSKLLYGFRTGCSNSEGEPTEVKLLHDPGAKTETMGKVQKHLTLSSPKGPSVGFMLNLAEFGGQEKLIHTVPLLPEEALVLCTLFQAAIVKMLAWS